nr:MAG TPA: hypothetical protein [Caudoviricetes sp.]DAJ55846.1 MAG TPA: hypothetical protein [Caudoviricetes sp.]
MTNRTFTDRNGASWVRVSKRRARSAYNEGYTIRLAPVNMHPFGPWPIYAEINTKFGVPFENRINAFEYYNCSNKNGKYSAYYIRTGA